MPAGQHKTMLSISLLHFDAVALRLGIALVARFVRFIRKVKFFEKSLLFTNIAAMTSSKINIAKRNYDPADAASIFAFSKGLLHKTLAEAVTLLDSTIKPEDIVSKGKGGLGQMVEKFYYGYEPNSCPDADFQEAGVELKTTPLKRNVKEELQIKERLVCDMIDFCRIVDIPFEDSPFYKKSLLMLIIFYLHVKGVELRDLEFLYSVLWKLQDKDLLIIKQDYETIVSKIKAGKAHELSEGDTLYLAACRKGQKGDALRKQPFSDIGAPQRAFSLKPAYMRTILDFVKSSGKEMVTNTDIRLPEIELVSVKELASSSFEQVMIQRFDVFKGQDYRQIAGAFKMGINPHDKSRYARVVKRIMKEGLAKFEDAEEVRKAGLVVKTVRVEVNGRIKEDMSFENIDYEEVYETEDWVDSRWYEIVTSRFLFVVFRAVEGCRTGWDNETRYVLDKVFFWTMPSGDMKEAEDYWLNIRQNVVKDTLQDSTNTYWKLSDGKDFHVRPKARRRTDVSFSPVSKVEVPKKAYWFNGSYVQKILQWAYAGSGKGLFEEYS